MGPLTPILRPPLQPILRSVFDVGVGGGSSPLPIPVGFDWTPPVSVYKSGSTYSTNFNANDWRYPSTLDIWIAVGGSDTTGDGSQGNPYRSLSKALTIANAAADTGITVHVAAGMYDRNRVAASSHSIAATKSVNVIAEGGRAIFSTRYEALSWSLHAPGVYTATRSNVVTVVDASLSVPVVLGGISRIVHSRLVNAADLAACVATAGTWFASGSDLYVHLADGRVPDNNCLVMGNITNCSITLGPNLYFENVVFEGGQTAGASFVLGNSSTSTGTSCFNGCDFSLSNTNGIAVTGGVLAVMNNCAAYTNLSDGFNYHGAISAGVSPNVIEISSFGFKNGGGNPGSDQGSTIHEDIRALRVNCEYYENNGPGVADVTTSMAWMTGCSSHDSASTGSSATDSGFLTADTAQVWLDGCTTEGVTYDLYASGGTILYRNMVPASTGGAGTIGTY